MEPWRKLDLAGADEARQLLTTCCGAAQWVESMMERRPFGSAGGLDVAAHESWLALEPDDWREAFAHHPKIGDREALRTRFAATRTLSACEQSGVDGATDAVLDELADGNRRYEERFGFIFIVCATGKSAGEMLAILRGRLDNDPAKELVIAAGEQAKITGIRLASLA